MELAFGECTIAVERHELHRSGEPVPVEPQVFDVLAYLVTHRERVVPKTELLDEIWGSRFVSESALTSRIKSARRAVGDTGRDQRVIRTIHGRGYRFVADVDAVDDVRSGTADRDGANERDASLDGGGSHERVRAAVDDVVAGTGAVVAVRGVAGPRRSELVHDVVEAAVTAGLVVGRSRRADPAAQPFRCVPSALDELVQRRPALLDDVPPACRTELERVLGGGMPTTAQRLVLAARELLVAAARRGAVLVVEDPVCRDAVTKAVLEEAAAIARRQALLVLLVAEPDVVPPVPSAVVDLPAGGAAEPAGGAAEPAGGAAEPVGGAADPVGDAPARRDGAAARPSPARPDVAPGPSPEEVASELLAAGRTTDAVPHAVAAAERAARAQLHQDVLRWTDVALDAAPDLPAALALRADALAATGDPGTVAAYRRALRASTSDEAAGLRARLARAAVLSGDLESAADALDGLEPDGGPHDGAVLLVRGMLAYFAGDLDAAEQAVERARALALAPGAPERLLDVITLQGMIAHSRGDWFDRLRRELLASRENPELAGVVFDSHLCVAEYLLYGPTPYDEVIALAEDLRGTAERTGARRGVAFAATVVGEAALLAGDLERARRELTEAVEEHRRMGADAGAAHALQRLAEVELAAGARNEAERLLRQAVTLARFSPLGRHLLQRTYGTLIAASPDATAAMSVVDEAEAVMDEPGSCVFCEVMVAVPAAIACAELGDLERAERLLERGELSAALWQGTAWQAAVAEGRAHLARARGDRATAVNLLAEAAKLFEAAGQPLDAARCEDALLLAGDEPG